MGVRAALEANKLANQRVAAGEWSPNQEAPPPDEREVRAEELHKKLGIDKVQLVTSPLHIDDSWDGGPPVGMELPPPPPPPTEAELAEKAKKMRGSSWPVAEAYFVPNKSPPKTSFWMFFAGPQISSGCRFWG